jgi:hypothetical protein
MAQAVTRRNDALGRAATATPSRPVATAQSTSREARSQAHTDASHERRERPQNGPLQPFAQQLDTDGRLHDIAPEHERLRLFEPDVQLPGQTWLELDDDA